MMMYVDGIQTLFRSFGVLFEYGDFDEYYRTCKSYMVCSGELVNPTAVYLHSRANKISAS
jgi:hypothetical protein